MQKTKDTETTLCVINWTMGGSESGDKKKTMKKMKKKKKKKKKETSVKRHVLKFLVDAQDTDGPVHAHTGVEVRVAVVGAVLC